MRFFIFFLSIFFSCHADELHKLTVSGSVTVSRPADELHMTVGVVTQDESVQKAIQQNREKMGRVQEAIRRAGFSEKEYQTGTFQIAPQYAPQPKTIPPDWHPEIVGYEVRNTIAIQTAKLDLAGPAIDAVVKQGANLVEGLSFTLQDMQQAKSEAIAQAVRQARGYAEAAAKEAGIALGNVLELAINPSQVVPRIMRMEKFALAAEATPLTPGDVEVSSTVSLIYEIKNARTP